MEFSLHLAEWVPMLLASLAAHFSEIGMHIYAFFSFAARQHHNTDDNISA
jgi:hypothetical protein